MLVILMDCSGAYDLDRLATTNATSSVGARILRSLVVSRGGKGGIGRQDNVWNPDKWHSPSVRSGSKYGLEDIVLQ